MTSDQERAVDALALTGEGFAVSEGDHELVRDGLGRHFVVADDGKVTAVELRETRTPEQLHREVYEDA